MSNPTDPTTTSAQPVASSHPVLFTRTGQIYEPAVGPRLMPVLLLLILGFAVLAATGCYLLVVRLLDAYQSFSLWMLLVHILAGFAFVLPFFVFSILHWRSARQRPNRLAVRLGKILFFVSVAVVISGVALVQLDGMPQLPTGTYARWVVYLLHVIAPVAVVALYVMHRRAGPAIRWRWGGVWAGLVAIFVVAMVVMHYQDPRKWYARGSVEGEKYFEPSKSRTVAGDFIPASTLMMDDYCRRCHADISDSHAHSVHKFSSFNNPAYLFSIRETRKTAGVRASRWCAGCHDPVPFFSGAFDNPKFDDVHDPTAKAGITCTVCHGITAIHSRSGNGDYTIEEPIHYPFARSDNAVLQWLNNQLVKAKPAFHKKTFLKPFHRTEEFCSVCHKVGIPQEVNHYKEFLRGQNHSDSFFLSGVSGHGSRSFYYPPAAKTNCADCHMPLVPSNDFGSRDFDGSGTRKVHNHLFPAANTGVAALLKFPGHEETIRAHADFLTKGPDGKSPTMRVDLFGIKLVQTDPLSAVPSALAMMGSPVGLIVAAPLLERTRLRGVETPLLGDQPLRPHMPTLVPGNTYQCEVVVRTLNMGHHFTQGTVDSNEVWVEISARAGDRVLGSSGIMTGDDDGNPNAGEVDPWAHFLNVFVLDRHGNRIDRRNPQDIFTTLYNHQIPPGAANVLHYRLHLPHDLPAGRPVEINVRVRYRKFDYRYMKLVHNNGPVPELPIVDLCSDHVVLPVSRGNDQVAATKSEQKSAIPAWQRWNDYGIGCFLEGGPSGKMGGELRQAELAFARLIGPEFADVPQAHPHGHLNLARVHLAYGGVERLEMARQALEASQLCDPKAPGWTVAWFNGLIDMQNVNFERAITQFEKILHHKDPARRFDFSTDYVVINELGKAWFLSAQQQDDPATYRQYLQRAIQQFEKTLTLDAENVDAHEFLAKSYGRLAEHNEQSDANTMKGGADVGKNRDSALLALLDPLVPPAKRMNAAVVVNQSIGDKSIRQLLEMRAELWDAYRLSDDSWMRLSFMPILSNIDRRLLQALPQEAGRFAENRERSQGVLLASMLRQLNQRPPLPDLETATLSLPVLHPGLPVNLALATLAQRDVLAGGLPPTRWLTTLHVREKLHPVAVRALDNTAHTADDALLCEVMAQVHLLFHDIYRPDDNARDRVIRIVRSRNLAANHASHAIVIRDLKLP